MSSALPVLPVVFTTDTFDAHVLAASMPVLVEFWAEWCGTCKAMAPVIQALATSFAGRVVVGTVDVEAHPEVADRYGVRGLPTILLFSGGHVVGQATGFVSQHVLAAHLEAITQPGTVRDKPVAAA